MLNSLYYSNFIKVHQLKMSYTQIATNHENASRKSTKIKKPTTTKLGGINLNREQKVEGKDTKTQKCLLFSHTCAKTCTCYDVYLTKTQAKKNRALSFYAHFRAKIKRGGNACMFCASTLKLNSFF